MYMMYIIIYVILLFKSVPDLVRAQEFQHSSPRGRACTSVDATQFFLNPLSFLFYAFCLYYIISNFSMACILMHIFLRSHDPLSPKVTIFAAANFFDHILLEVFVAIWLAVGHISKNTFKKCTKYQICRSFGSRFTKYIYPPYMQSMAQAIKTLIFMDRSPPIPSILMYMFSVAVVTVQNPCLQVL